MDAHPRWDQNAQPQFGIILYMKQTNIVLAIVAGIAVVFGLGYYVGTKGILSGGSNSAGARCLAVIDSVFPKPPDIIKNASGVVKGVYGALLSVEMANPDDYIPHTDGTPAQTLSVGLNINSQTLVRMANASGVAPVTAKLSDIKVGDTVRFWSDSNIRGAKQVDATLVQIIR